MKIYGQGKALPNLSFQWLPKSLLKKTGIWYQEGGVISENPCWCCYSQGYLYIEDTLLKLLWVMLTEWKHDKHIVG